MREVQHQTNLLIKHVAVEALGPQERHVPLQQSLLGLGGLQVDLGLGYLPFKGKQGHDPAFALDGVISEVDDRTHAKKRWQGTPRSPEKITQIPHDLK